MLRKLSLAVVFVFSFAFLCLPLVSADEGMDDSTQALLERIEDLEKKVNALTNRLSIYEKAPTVTVPDEVIQKKVDDILAKKQETEGGLLKALQDINLSGFVDTSYSYNFNSPEAGTNAARVFDTEANNFNLQAAEVVLEKLPADSGGVGFRTDLYFGEDANTIGVTTPADRTGTSRTDQFDLEQAYITLKPPLNFNLPIGNWQWIKIGKFVTMHGAEVIEAKDNWNFTRSLLFGYAIPFTHTGIRAGYQLFDGLSAYFGINNGWDNVKDNNKTKSIEGALAWAANDKLSFNLAGMYGPEQSGNDHSQRGLIDFLATYKPFEKWTFMINADYGHEEDVVTTEEEDGSWSGVALYAKYDVNSWMSLVNRTEFFSDPQGIRVTTTPATPQELWETTYTLELRPYKNFITRLEYRYDGSTADIFTTNQKALDSQDTIALEVIYTF